LVSQIYYKILDIFNITNISTKQFSLALVAVVFATALVVDSIDAKKSKSNRQTIAQSCNQNQHSLVVTAGAGSPVLFSGNNLAVCSNTNNGGNAASF
jgi:hypothetical protein